MVENVLATPKMLAGIFGGFLTWLGAGVIIVPLVWWVTSSFQLDKSTLPARLLFGVAWCFAYSIARFGDRQRNISVKPKGLARDLRYWRS